MQHNRVTVLSSSETYHLGSSSNIPDMESNNAAVDEQIVMSEAVENDGLPRYLLNSQEMGMPSGNLIGQQSTGLNLWESAGSSSMGCLVDRDNLFQSKREHFAPHLSIGGPLRTDRRRHEGTSSLPSHNLNIDLNINQSDQFGTEDADVVPPSSGQSRANTILVNMGSSRGERIPRHEVAFDAVGSSSQSVDAFDGAPGQEGGGLDNHHQIFKRKNIDGSRAESSANGISRNCHQNTNDMLLSPAAHEGTSLNVTAASNYAIPYHPMELLNEGTNIATSSSLSDRYSLYNDPQEHGFVRNTRMRISPNDYGESLPNLLPEDSFRCSFQLTPQSSSFIPVQPRHASSSANAQGRPHLPAVTQFSQNLRHPSSDGNFGSQFGGSSSSPDTAIHISSHDSNGSLMSDLPEPLLLGSLYDADSTIFPTAPVSRGNQQNSIFSSSSSARVALNAGTQQVPGTNSSQPTASIRGSADMARRSLISAAARSSSIALHHRGSSSTSNDIRSHQPGSSSRAPQLHYSRGGPQSADRQNSSYLDLQSFMQTIAASRDGSRTVSEFRNVVDQIRQGRNARLEDLLLIDRSLIIRRANLIDRHRDMRLDVDNMSYEELLALGERIGYVNTGLSEEKIMTSLKQRKYVCLELEESSTIVEPCCICQEDYVEGEDVGRLDCGHDFHTACIKQWLVIKNLCPVCKNTALGT